MLSADLVRARRRGETLELRPLSAKEQASALLISQQILEEYRGAKGKTRAALEAALNEIPVAARDRKLYLALKKRIDDQATWSEAPERDPQILRRHVFLEAARARRETGTIDRAAILTVGRLSASRRGRSSTSSTPICGRPRNCCCLRR